MYKPLFRTDESGAVKFSRRPTLEEAEVIRRELRDLAKREGKAQEFSAADAKKFRAILKIKARRCKHRLDGCKNTSCRRSTKSRCI